ncbi:MAG TPA: nuclear transport factor 2 family protein [Burkholderiaceae bacterium]|nr:nuclear transport factor 2 family protein [Burkholderiaceae bacterium]
MNQLLKAVSGLALAIAAATALATPSDDERLHLEAAAAGNVDALMANYAEGATMYWNGGALDGVYAGPKQLRELWTTFAQKQGKLDLAIAQVQESVSPKGATVSANARFRGASQTKVRHVLVWRDGKIVSEIWQIDPAMQFQN